MPKASSPKPPDAALDVYAVGRDAVYRRLPAEGVTVATGTDSETPVQSRLPSRLSSQMPSIRKAAAEARTEGRRKKERHRDATEPRGRAQK